MSTTISQQNERRPLVSGGKPRVYLNGFMVLVMGLLTGFGSASGVGLSIRTQF